MRIPRHHGARFRAALAVAAVAAGAAALGFSDADPGLPIAAQVGGALGLGVRPDSLVWIGPPPEPGFSTAIEPHELAFLASKGSGRPADLYRATIALAPGPRVISASGLRNLTDSEDGDDFAIAAQWPYIAAVTRALGQVRSITVLDVRGQELPRDGSWSGLERLLGRLTDLQRAGRFGGFGRTNVRFERPPTAVDLSFAPRDGRTELLLEWADRAGARHLASVDLGAGRTASKELEVSAEMRLPKRPILWAVDSLRAVWWVGPGPIEWAEGRFFALKDRLHRWEYAVFGDDEEDEEEIPAGAGGVPAAKVARELPKPPPGLEIGADRARIEWPPRTVTPPVFKSRKRGEGEWVPAVPEFVKALPGAPPSVYRTFVRSDLERPYARAELLAMDMRQLELHMVGGQEDPRPTTGTTGTGEIPRDRGLLERFVAAFNGAFKTEHGAYGMMVERNVLLPPQDDAATVATYADGRIAMGSWPAGAAIPSEMVSYRQNMDPLVEDGVVNPRKRRLWGYTLGSDLSNMNTIRSGLCLTADGTMIYAWGDELTAKSLGIALNAAGCEYAIHLDMNPYHTAYIFYRFEELDKGIERPKFQAELVFPAMMYSPWRYVNGAPKDFFFVALKALAPPGDGWSAAKIAQPAPAFLPAAFRRRAGDVVVFAFDASRLRALLAPGDVPEGLAAVAEPADGDLLAEIGLGRFSGGRGQIAHGAVIAALAEGRASLAARKDGAVDVIPWADERAADDVVQGDWLVSGGAAREGRGMVVGVGRSPDGRFVYAAEGEFGDVAAALVGAGVQSAIAFARAGGAGSSVAVRGENGWVTGDGAAAPPRDGSQARLRLEAIAQRPVALRIGADAPPMAGR
jgi:hypothetical protein